MDISSGIYFARVFGKHKTRLLFPRCGRNVKNRFVKNSGEGLPPEGRGVSGKPELPLPGALFILPVVAKEREAGQFAA